MHGTSESQDKRVMSHRWERTPEVSSSRSSMADIPRRFDGRQLLETGSSRSGTADIPGIYKRYALATI